MSIISNNFIVLRYKTIIIVNILQGECDEREQTPYMFTVNSYLFSGHRIGVNNLAVNRLHW